MSSFTTHCPAVSTPLHAGDYAGENSSADLQISPEDLQEILEQVWASYLDSAQELLPMPVEAGADCISASVSVSGAYMGHVGFCTSTAAAREITSLLLAIEPDQVSADDMADGVGELANVIGGNLKSLLPGPSVLSLPIVLSSDSGQTMHWPQASVALQAQLSWRGQPVSVTVWAQSQTDQ